MEEKLHQLSIDLADEKSQKQALQEAWKVIVNSYEEKIDELRAPTSREA